MSEVVHISHKVFGRHVRAFHFYQPEGLGYGVIVQAGGTGTANQKALGWITFPTGYMMTKFFFDCGKIDKTDKHLEKNNLRNT